MITLTLIFSFTFWGTAIGQTSTLENEFGTEFSAGRWILPEGQSPQIALIQQDSDDAVIWVGFTDSLSGQILEIPASPIPASLTNNGTWLLSFPDETNYTSHLQEMPSSLMPGSVLREYVPMMTAQAVQNAGYYPWHGSMQVTQNPQNGTDCGSYSHCIGGSDEWAWDLSNGTSGWEVYAARGGRIAWINTSHATNSGCGGCDWTTANVIVIDLGDGYAAIYLHLAYDAPTRFQIGQEITQGQLIGFADQTGKTTGPHLHFAIQAWNSSWNGDSNPLVWYKRSAQSLFQDEPEEFPSYPNWYVSHIPTTTYTSWDFRHGIQGWTVNSSLATPTPQTEGLRYNVSGSDPYFTSPSVDVQAAGYPYIYLKMATQTDTCGQLYFGRERDATFSDGQKVDFVAIADGLTHTYKIDMSANASWTGKIVQLRLDPACNAVGSHWVRIDELAFLSRTTHWDFRSGSQGWLPIAGLSAAVQTPYGLFYDVTSNDPYIYGPMVNIAADRYPYIYVKMSSDNDACAQVFFRREGDADFVGAQQVPFYPAQNVTQGYILDMSQNALWTGNIVQLRFDPGCTKQGNHGVRVDELAALSSATDWDFRMGAQEWQPVSNLSAPGYTPYGLFYDVLGDDPYLYSPMMNIAAAQHPYVYVKMSSDNDACAQVFFRRQGEADFVGTQQVPFYPAQNVTQGYIIDMSQNALWTGNIVQLRFDPACFRTGNHGVRIDEFAVLSNATNWDFRNGVQGWNVTSSLSLPTQQPQGLRYDVTANDPWINGPVIHISAEAYPYVHITMATQTDTCGQVFFRRASDPDFVGTQQVVFHPIADGVTHEYAVNMADNPLWSGGIIQLRLDPACIRTGNHTVQINNLILGGASMTISPADGAPSAGYFTDSTPTLTWSAVSWATGYKIEVDSSPSFTLPLDFTTETTVNTLSATTSTLVPGTYYWRVQAKQADGTDGDWSPVQSFTVGS